MCLGRKEDLMIDKSEYIKRNEQDGSLKENEDYPVVQDNILKNSHFVNENNPRITASNCLWSQGLLARRQYHAINNYAHVIKDYVYSNSVASVSKLKYITFNKDPFPIEPRLKMNLKTNLINIAIYKFNNLTKINGTFLDFYYVCIVSKFNININTQRFSMKHIIVEKQNTIKKVKLNDDFCIVGNLSLKNINVFTAFNMGYYDNKILNIQPYESKHFLHEKHLYSLPATSFQLPQV